MNKKELVMLQNKLGADTAIGKHLGVSRQWIHILRKRFNIPRTQSKLHSERNAHIFSLRNDGASVEFISDCHNISTQRTYAILSKSQVLMKHKLNNERIHINGYEHSKFCT